MQHIRWPLSWYSVELVDSKSIKRLVTCSLIPLDKSPGVRPTGVGEVLWRTIGKAEKIVLKSDILNVTGYQQSCASLESGSLIASLIATWNLPDCLLQVGKRSRKPKEPPKETQ